MSQHTPGLTVDPKMFDYCMINRKVRFCPGHQIRPAPDDQNTLRNYILTEMHSYILA